MNPAVRISIDERVGDPQRLPRRRVEAGGRIQSGSHALVERQVRTLEVVVELDYIEVPVPRQGQNGL
jgi:hypothetical protein